MRRHVWFPATFILVSSVLFASVATGGTPDDSSSNQSRIPPYSLVASPGTSSSPLAGSDEEAALFLSRARDAEDNNHLTEAIKAYITVLAVAEQNPGGKAAAQYALKAQTELTRIGTRLSIEPNEAWLDSAGKQLSGSTRSAGKDGSLQPAVYLYENFGSGKAPIPDAPIYFEFVENSGTMNGFVDTDSFGRANTAILKLADASKAATVRATPVFKSRGFTYAFKTVIRDFNYLPPSNTVLTLSLSRSELGAVENSLAADVIAPQIKALGLQVQPASGAVQQAAFLSAMQGDPAAVSKLLAKANAGYLVLVFVDIDAVKQYEYEGKVYNMFSAYGKAALRLIRADGTIVYSIPLEKLKGDGGTKAKAVDNAYIQAHEQLSKGLNSNLGAVKEALAKE